MVFKPPEPQRYPLQQSHVHVHVELAGNLTLSRLANSCRGVAANGGHGSLHLDQTCDQSCVRNVHQLSGLC